MKLNILLNKTVNKIKNKKIITISETNHFSYTSHTIHYKLLKKIHKNNIINCFTSERLGLIDAFLMNKWLLGEIKCSLKYLYTALPFGGLGTYRWMKYFKKTKIKYFLVGCELDDIKNINYKDRTIKLLKSVSSDNLKNHIQFNNIIKVDILTENDKIIKDIINKNIKNKDWIKKRYTFWYNEINKNIKKYSKIYINGFHLQYSSKELGLKLKNKYKNNMISLGIASKKVEVFGIFITNKFLKDNNLKVNDYINNTNKFLDIIYSNDKFLKHCYIKDNIVELTKYFSFNYEYMKKPSYSLINFKNSKYYIFKGGCQVFPILNDVNINKNKIYNGIFGKEKIKEDYDYILLIPSSKIERTDNCNCMTR